MSSSGSPLSLYERRFQAKHRFVPSAGFSKYSEMAECQVKTTPSTKSNTVRITLELSDQLPLNPDGRSMGLRKKSPPQLLPGQGAVTTHGHLRKPEHRADLCGAHLLKVPENKDDPLLAAERAETIHQLFRQLRRGHRPVGRRGPVRHPSRDRRIDIFDRHDPRLAVLPEVVIDRMNRDAVKPFEERFSRSEAPDIPKDFDEGILAGIHRIVARQPHLKADGDDPSFVEAHQV